MKQSKDFWKLPLALVGAAALPLSAMYYCARLCLYDPKQQRGLDQLLPAGEPYDGNRDRCLDMIQKTKALPWERVEIRSKNGISLVGHYHHTKDGAPVDLCFHGYKGTAFRDFSGGARLLISLGHNVLLVDQRGQGESGGKYMAFGILERHDCLSWIEWALDKFGSGIPICLYGISMGAATVLMASGLPLPENVKGIVADCPYSSPKDIIETVAKYMGYPAHSAYMAVRAGGLLYGGFDLEEITAAEAVKKTKVPILLIHGEADGLVPCDMSRPIYEANPRLVQRETFPNAQHGFSFMVDPDRYKKLVTDFLTRILD